MYLSTSTSTQDLSEIYLSTLQVLYKLYLSTDVLKGNMNNPRLDSTLYRVYVPTSICTKSKKSKKSIDLVIPHYSDHISTEANIHIQSKQRQQMTWIKSRGSRDKTRSNIAVGDFIFHMDRNVRENFLPPDWSRVVNRATCSVN